MRTRLSICLKKASYATERDAILFAHQIDLPLRPYRCDRCGKYHLTSRRKGKRIPRVIE